MNYEENDYIEQYKDLKLFFKEYVGEPIFHALISYPDLKTKNSIELIDLRHQPDHITRKKNQQFQEYGTDPDNAILSLLRFTRREIELLGDGNKLLEVKVI